MQLVVPMTAGTGRSSGRSRPGTRRVTSLRRRCGLRHQAYGRAGSRPRRRRSMSSRTWDWCVRASASAAPGLRRGLVAACRRTPSRWRPGCVRVAGAAAPDPALRGGECRSRRPGYARRRRRCRSGAGREQAARVTGRRAYGPGSGSGSPVWPLGSSRPDLVAPTVSGTARLGRARPGPLPELQDHRARAFPHRGQRRPLRRALRDRCRDLRLQLLPLGPVAADRRQERVPLPQRLQPLLLAPALRLRRRGLMRQPPLVEPGPQDREPAADLAAPVAAACDGGAPPACPASGSGDLPVAFSRAFTALARTTR